MQLSEKLVGEIIDRALIEDLGSGDVTTDALINNDLQGRAHFLVKADGILAGMEIAKRVFTKVDSQLKFEILIRDGKSIKSGEIIARVSGKLSGILKAERTALNFLQLLSGIATETSRYVAAVKGLQVKILDTRKTTPGLRVLEKFAVKTGGGQNHRSERRAAGTAVYERRKSA